ncbi:MAG: sugar transferase [Ruminococcaceae bacterium]|nr:sugar transferase [Oscillospiraceae bacterium]
MEDLKTTVVEEQVNTEVAEDVVMVKSNVVLKKKPVYDFLKRFADILISVIALTCGLPFFIIIALVIMIDDFGNPFFMQERIGKDGKAFQMFKFRTMFMHADEMKVDLMAENEYDSVHFKMSNDPRITRVGKFLRKTSLDELPQILNVLLGHMTIIGPRPFVRVEQNQLPSDRLLVKPGLSCYWQITDTVKMSNEDQLELDYKYIRNRSIGTDIKIIWDTVMLILKGSNI